MKSFASSMILAALLAAGSASAQRLGPVSPDKMTDDQRKVIADVKVGPRTALFDPLLPMLRNPELAYSAERFGEAVYYKSGLEPRIYELTVLLLGRHTMQQFEWRVHYPLAIKAGIKQADVDAIGAGKKPRSLAEDEAIAYDFVVQLLKTNDVSDATYGRFVARFGEAAVVSVVGVLGYYNTIALMMNAEHTPLHDGNAPMLKPLKHPFP